MERLTAGNIIPATLTASAIMGLLASFGFFMVVATPVNPIAEVQLSPAAAVVNLGGTFTTSLALTAKEPVNAFTGHIKFDPAKLRVEKIDYNTSIADLWAEAPWYQNGDGSIHFAGGTTQPGGFTGTGNIMTVTFTTIGAGSADVSLHDIQVLRHDGLGTEAPLATPIDALFTVTDGATQIETSQPQTAVIVRDPRLTADLNSDGVVSVTDVSIFFVHLTTSNPASDFNGDGRISTSDLSILISQM